MIVILSLGILSVCEILVNHFQSIYCIDSMVYGSSLYLSSPLLCFRILDKPCILARSVENQSEVAILEVETQLITGILRSQMKVVTAMAAPGGHNCQNVIDQHVEIECTVVDPQLFEITNLH